MAEQPAPWPAPPRNFDVWRETLLHALVQNMRRHGAKTCAVQYSGSRDDFLQSENVTLDKAGNTAVTYLYPLVNGGHYVDNCWVPHATIVRVRRTASLSRLAEECVDVLSEVSHGDWASTDSDWSEFFIDIDEGRVSYQHHDHYTERDIVMDLDLRGNAV